MSTTTPAFSLLAVEPHPDDESIGMGGTLARYSAEGVRTTLVTATRGEVGEILDKELDPKEAAPRLATIREAELRNAVKILGVTELVFLGYEDSGMAGLVLGITYMLSGRNLWACILAHGFIDTFGVIALFFGWQT